MKTVPSLLMLFSCIACSKPDSIQTKETPPYVVSKIDSTLKAQWVGSSIPPPPKVFYTDYNFIVDNKSEQVFLHRKKFMLFCGTGVDFTKPDFLYLTPEDFKLLSKDEIQSYFTDTLPNLNNQQAIVLASFQDSIKLKEVRTFIDSVFIARNIPRFNIRMVTEEERIVLEHKKQNLPYFADSIQWSDNFTIPFIHKRKRINSRTTQ
ncbi:hypothetical protein [Pontibacter fetidus]|uniref:Lipoprotein n=1 Tax=Pontibacter fetidus TaxID=2700082 RepID=A0A6B2HAF7_9BACT|nr:hypothetical protein [Pontibacter fetidus]NDK57300.1 hypothetical protein [Pontibacter fetidus]